jgi:uncharacterized protein YdaU (DUF1376 family)
MSLPYYKRFPRDFLDGTVGFTLEQKGAYSCVLDLIFMRGGNMPDDAGYVAGQLGCSVRKWNTIREFLIGRGKLTIKNGIISNFRADDLLEETRKYREQKAENRSVPNKNKEQEERPLTKRAEIQIPDTETTLSRVVTAQAPAATPEKPKRKAAPKGAARGSRIAPNWAPTPKDYAFASSNGLTREEINREADRFRNYWLAATKNAAKCDWEATWRNWLTGEFGIVTKKRAALDRGNAKGDASFAGIAASMEGYATGAADPTWSDGDTIEGEFAYAAPDAGHGQSERGRGGDRADALPLLASGQRRAG